MIETALMRPGFRGLCVREVQKALERSAKPLLEDTIQAYRVGGEFNCLKTHIETPGGGIIAFVGMQDHTAESVKSFEGFDVAWVEEAQTLSRHSLSLLRPTIRKEGSEIWASWNPRHRKDAIDEFLRGDGRPGDAVVVQANWRDNPWFPEVLNVERLEDKKKRPDTYAHIWEGDYAQVTDGAYYARQLAEARESGRIGNVAPDPLIQYRAFWDIGVSDSMTIWVAQFVGREIRVLNYCEGQGQPLSYYVEWLRANGYGSALCVLPHDGAKRDTVSAVRFDDHLRQAGFSVRTVENQGKGAAMKRIEAARRLFPAIWFNEPTTKTGIEALGAYHERKDEKRDVGLGPEHDWASHGADSFGLMCVAYEQPEDRPSFEWSGPVDWMAA